METDKNKIKIGEEKPATSAASQIGSTRKNMPSTDSAKTEKVSADMNPTGVKHSDSREEHEVDDFFKLDINSFIARVMLRPPPSPPSHDYENIWIDENDNNSHISHSAVEKENTCRSKKSTVLTCNQSGQRTRHNVNVIDSSHQLKPSKKTIFGLPGPEAFLNLITIPECLPPNEIRSHCGRIESAKNCGIAREVDFIKILGGLYSTSDDYRRALQTPLEEDYAKLVTPPPPPPLPPATTLDLDQLNSTSRPSNNSAALGNCQNSSNLRLSSTASSLQTYSAEAKLVPSTLCAADVTTKLKETLSATGKGEISGIELTIPLSRKSSQEYTSVHTAPLSLSRTNPTINLSLHSKPTVTNETNTTILELTPLTSQGIQTELNESKNRTASIRSRDLTSAPYLSPRDLTAVSRLRSDIPQPTHTGELKFSTSSVHEESFGRLAGKQNAGVCQTDADAIIERLQSQTDKCNQVLNSAAAQMSSIDQIYRRKQTVSDESGYIGLSKAEKAAVHEQHENLGETKGLLGPSGESSYVLEKTNRRTDMRVKSPSGESKEINSSAHQEPGVVSNTNNISNYSESYKINTRNTSSQLSDVRLSDRPELKTSDYTSQLSTSTRVPLRVQKRSLTAPVSSAIKHGPPVPPRSGTFRINRSSTSVPAINSEFTYVRINNRMESHKDKNDANEFRTHPLYSSRQLQSFRKSPANTSNPEISFQNKSISEMGSDKYDLYNSRQNVSKESQNSPQGTLTRSVRPSIGITTSPDGTLRPRRVPPTPPPRRLKAVQSLAVYSSNPNSRRESIDQQPLDSVTSAYSSEVILRKTTHDRFQTGKQDTQARLSASQRNSYIKMSQNLDELLRRNRDDDLHSLRPVEDTQFSLRRLDDDQHSMRTDDGSDVYPAQIHPNRLRVSSTTFASGTNVSPINQIIVPPPYSIHNISSHPDDSQSIASSCYSESRFVGNSREVKPVAVSRSVPSSPLAILRSKFKAFWSPASRKRKSAQRNSISGSVPSNCTQSPPTPPTTARHGFRKKVFGNKTLDANGKMHSKDFKSGEDIISAADDEEFILTSRNRSVTCEEDIKSCGNVFATVEEIPVFHRTQPSSRRVILRREAKPIDSDVMDISRTNWEEQNCNDWNNENRNRNKVEKSKKLNTFTGS